MLALLPVLASDLYRAGFGSPTIAEMDLTVEFEAMPLALNGRVAWTRSKSDVTARCMHTKRDAPADSNRYRCVVKAPVPSGLNNFLEVLFPPDEGWKARVVASNATTLLPVDEWHTVAIQSLWILLLLGLGYRLGLLSTSAPANIASCLRWSIVALAAILASDAIATLIYEPSAITSAVERQFLSEFRAFPVRTALLLVLAAPLMEELLFRGVGWAWLKQHLPLPAVVAVTSVVFALLHTVDTVTFLLHLSGALWLAVVRLKTGHVSWCILVHACSNAMVVAAGTWQ